MTWLAVDKSGDEYAYIWEPYRECENGYAYWVSESDCVELPKGSIKKLIGKELTWSDEPIEI